MIGAVWIAASLFGFWLGWDAGGNDFRSKGLEAAARNAFYGLFFGAAQTVVLRLALPMAGKRLLAWPIVTMLAFALGVHFWKYWAGGVPGFGSLPTCMQLGLSIGLPMALAHAWALRWAVSQIPLQALRAWFAADVASWLVIEFLACAIGYGGLRIPAVILPGSLPTALALAYVAHAASAASAATAPRDRAA
jgi:hypothetical protein